MRSDEHPTLPACACGSRTVTPAWSMDAGRWAVICGSCLRIGPHADSEEEAMKAWTQIHAPTT